MHEKVGGMCFKSLGTFNLAMLGKQGWRILTLPIFSFPVCTKLGTFRDAIFLNPHWIIILVLFGEAFLIPSLC